MPRRARRLYPDVSDELKHWARPDHHLVKVTKVSDGDTVHVHIMLGFGVDLPEVRVRLLGIQAPELIGAEKHQGHAARRELAKLVLDRFVGLQTYRDQTGKHGRELGVLWQFTESNMININQRMIDLNLAKPLYVNRFFDARPEHRVKLLEQCAKCKSFLLPTPGQGSATRT